MSRKITSFLDCGIDEEIDPKFKFNSLISVTVSTIMCIAAGCPLPKSNVDTTKLFLSTITDENGEVPRNIKGLITVLKNYSGPYDTDARKEKRIDRQPSGKNSDVDKDKEIQKIDLQTDNESKISVCQVMPREVVSMAESNLSSKRIPKANVKRPEKETKKTGRALGSKISHSKSIISKL